MSAIEFGSYTAFSAAIHTEVNGTRVPVSGTIEVTNRCPLTCAHCYNNLPMGDAAARARELTTEEHYRLLDELADVGCLWLLFSGGEIFARRDFLDIYTYAKKKGFLITLFTNGTMITEAIADYLVKWPPFSIEITLYGATRGTYEALTRVPGSFDRCMRGIALLLERKLPLQLKAVAVSINKHEVDAMKEVADSFGVEFKFDAMINPRIDCSASPLAVRLNAAEIVQLDLRDPRRVAEWQRMAIGFAPEPTPGSEVPQMYECGAGVNSFAIDPYGDLTMCVISHVDRYNVRDGSFREGWEFLGGVRRRKVTRLTKCTECGLKSMCGMCPANGQLENGDPENPVDFLCQVAHLRAMSFDIPIRPHGDCEYCETGEKHEIVRVASEALRSGEAERIAAIPATISLPAASGCASGSCGGCSVASPLE